MTQQRPTQAGDRSGRPASRGTAICVVLGGLLGAALWSAWQPSAGECSAIDSCLGRLLWGLIATSLAIPVTLVVLWLARVRPVFVTTVLGLAAGGALVMATSTVLGARGGAVDGMAPWWVWVLVGAVSLGLSHWVHQPGRSWLARVVPVVLVVGLVAGGVMWAQGQRDAAELDRLAGVGVSEVRVPTVPGYHLGSAWPGEFGAEGGEAIVLTYYADEGVQQSVRGLLLPVDGRDACELALQAQTPEDQMCDLTDGVLDLSWHSDDGEVWYVGAGQVIDDTLVVLTTSPEVMSGADLNTAIDTAEPTTLEALRDL